MKELHGSPYLNVYFMQIVFYISMEQSFTMCFQYARHRSGNFHMYHLMGEDVVVFII
jgi:hypothetical protein